MKGSLQAREMASLVDAITTNLSLLGTEEGLTLDIGAALPPLKHLEPSQVKNILHAFLTFTNMLPASTPMQINLNVAPSDSRVDMFLSSVERALQGMNNATKESQAEEINSRTAIQEAAASVRSVQLAPTLDSVAATTERS